MQRRKRQKREDKLFRILSVISVLTIFTVLTTLTVYGAGDVATAIQNTWNSAKGLVQSVVNNVVFPVVDTVLAVLFFVKLSLSYMEYKKHGQFDVTAPAILFGCLVFALTAPLYIWTVI